MNIVISAARFDLGEVVLTPGAWDALTQDDVLKALVRHLAGDWGELGDEDRKQNDDALEGGGRLLSRFTSRVGTAFYIVTESDRSVTTLLLPEEY